MHSLDFIHFFVSRKSHKILTELRYFHVILTEKSPVNIDFALLCFVKIPSVRFRFLFVGELRFFKLGFHGKDERHAKRLCELTFLLGDKRKIVQKREAELF